MYAGGQTIVTVPSSKVTSLSSFSYVNHGQAIVSQCSAHIMSLRIRNNSNDGQYIARRRSTANLLVGIDNRTAICGRLTPSWQSADN